MIIYDQARPFTMEFGADTRQIVVTIPRALLASRLPEVERFTARRIASALETRSANGDGWYASWSSSKLCWMKMSLTGWRFRSRHSGNDPRCGIFGRCGGRRRNHGRLTRVKRYVVANLHDPEMTVNSIAAAQNLAPRTLHRLFSAEGTTPIRWLWQQRLSASYKALAEGHIRHVTDAALTFGFTDLSHFSRAFKKMFGHAPHTLARR